MTNLDSILDALADALVEKIAARLPPGGQQQTYTVAQLAERYGMSKSSISRRVRAGSSARPSMPAPAPIWSRPRAWPGSTPTTPALPTTAPSVLIGPGGRQSTATRGPSDGGQKQCCI